MTNIAPHFLRRLFNLDNIQSPTKRTSSTSKQLILSICKSHQVKFNQSEILLTLKNNVRLCNRHCNRNIGLVIDISRNESQ